MFDFLPRSALAGLFFFGVLWASQAALAQTTQGRESTSQTALPPQLGEVASDDQGSLTPRERQLLKRVQDLEERLSVLEKKASSASDSQNAHKQIAPAEHDLQKGSDSK